jgi:Questin oxidase-like
MPYDPDALLSKRMRDALADEKRVEEIKRLVDLWFGVAMTSTASHKITELFYVATLLFVATSKPPPHKPRLDFFLMHILNATLFLPSLFHPSVIRIDNEEGKNKILKAFLATALITLVVRGRPRINAGLIEGYDAVPMPPSAALEVVEGLDPTIIGNLSDKLTTNPWPVIIGSALHGPDVHALKAIRALMYASKVHGAEDEVPGAFMVPSGEISATEKNGNNDKKEETHEGISRVDGTLFIRAAGVVMDVMGWNGYPMEAGGKVGSWDRSALGWEDAWK